MRHHQDQKYAAQDEAAYEQPADEQAYEQAEPEPSYIAELEKLADLKAKGVLTEEEFAAKKQQLLGL